MAEEARTMPIFLRDLDGGRSTPGTHVETSCAVSEMRSEHKFQALDAPIIRRDCVSPTESENRSSSPMDLDKDSKGATKNEDDLKQIGDFLASHDSFLERLRQKVTGSGVKDRVLVFENLQWDILKESGGLNWFGLACKLVGYITICSNKVLCSEDKAVILQKQVDQIGDQIDELKLCLETDSGIFKIAAGTLLYTVAVIEHIERKINNSGSCCSPVKSFIVRKPLSDGLPYQLDEVLGELKVLQDNLMFATLSAVGNRVSGSISKTTQGWQALSVGVDQHVRDIINHFKRSGVRLVGIHGQAGVGKTTLLNEVVAKLQTTHKRLFASVEVGERPDDLRRLQASLLQQLGGGRKEFASTAQGRNALLYQLQKLKYNNKQARIAIDNLFDIRLIGELFPHSLGKVLPLRTLIIVTSPSLVIINRLDQLCRPAAPQYHYLPYKLPSLTALQSKTLFLSHAGSVPVMRHGTVNKFAEVVDHILLHCDGNPLTLKVTGSYFSQEANLSQESLSTVSKKMKASEELDSAEDRLFSNLQVIYDRLEKNLKDVFLDISIFFRGWDCRIVERIVGQSQMESLMSQALIATREKDSETMYGIAQWTRYSEYPWKVNLVGMHDVLATIGCRRAQGNRVLSEDQNHLPERLLVDGPGNELSNIQGLSILSCKEAVQGHMLEKMHSLRLLMLHDTGVRGHCTKVLHNLQFFYWGRSQPSSEVKIPFQMNRLRKLEVLILRAHEIDLNLKYPPQLKDLTLIGCNNMEELPDAVTQLAVLVELHLFGCSRLQYLSEGLGNLCSLTRLHVENCGAVKELPRSLGSLTNLKEIDLSGCQNLTSLTPEIGTLSHLKKLDLSRCKSLTRLPSEIGGLHSLSHLFLGHCPLSSICPEIGKLGMLEELSLTYCGRLEKLPREIGNLAFLERLNLSSCVALKELPKEIGCLGSLLRLNLSSCTALLRLPEEIWGLTTLQVLDLDYCKHLSQVPKDIGHLSSLESLSLNCCTKLTKLPVELIDLPSLQIVNVVGCTGLKGELPHAFRGPQENEDVPQDYSFVNGEGSSMPPFSTYT